MHSRIFQVNTKPIDVADYIRESDYYDHWFTHQIADYVDGDTDRDSDIIWISTHRGCAVGKDDNGDYLIIHNKEEYFESAYIRFKQLLEEMGEPTIEDFVNANGINMWLLENVYDDKFGIYIDSYISDYGNELMTLDMFVRRCEVGVKYYIGGTMFTNLCKVPERRY